MQAGNMELEVPELESVLNPPKGNRKWLIATCCFVINLCNTVVIAMIAMASGYSSSWGSDKRDEILDAYVIVLKCGVIVAAVVMVWVGYRITAVLGGIMVGASLFITSFIEDNAEASGFLVAGVAALGGAMLQLSTIVPVLEYFIINRIWGVVYVYLGEIIGLVIVLVVAKGGDLGIESLEDVDFKWQNLYRYQLIPIGVAVLCGFFLKPLNLRLSEGNSSVLKRILGVASWKQLQGFLLAVVLIMSFVFSYGKGLTQNKILNVASDRRKDIEDEDQLIILFSPYMGQFVGIIALLFFRKRHPAVIFVVLAISELIAGPLTCAAPAFEAFWLILIYGIIYGLALAVFENLLDNTVPKTFGRQHIRLVEGFIGLAMGVGEIASTKSEEDIEEMMDRSRDEYKAIFYVGGGLLILTGILAGVSRAVYGADKNRQNFDDDIDSDE